MRDKKKRQLGAVISLPPAPAQTPNPVTLTVECCAASRTEQPSGACGHHLQGNTEFRKRMGWQRRSDGKTETPGIGSIFR